MLISTLAAARKQKRAERAGNLMRRIVLKLIAPLALVSAPTLANARVIGTNTPAPQLTAERINALPPAERRAWQAYVARSERQMRADRAVIAAERRGLAQTPAPPTPPTPASRNHMDLTRDAAWYATPEARAIADTIVSFQTPAGGWSKNQDRAGPPRLRGQSFSNNAETMARNPDNFDTPQDNYWTYVGTLDNDATATELRFLARVAAQLPGREGNGYRASFLRGVRYLLDAQYPNGGWPQIWPLEGGYHDGVTFNDNALINAVSVLDDVAQGRADMSFAPANLRTQAAAARRRAIDVILATQVVIDGRKTGWPQQVDGLTLAPMSARNYEPVSLASSETAAVLDFLMRQPNPTLQMRTAIHSAADWLRNSAIYGRAWGLDPRNRVTTDAPGAGPIWSRFYSITTGQPIFGDVDKSLHDDVNNISLGRRTGYAWYHTAPIRTLERYAAWVAANP